MNEKNWASRLNKILHSIHGHPANISSSSQLKCSDSPDICSQRITKLFSKRVSSLLKNEKLVLACLYFGSSASYQLLCHQEFENKTTDFGHSNDSQILTFSAGLALFLLTAPQKPLFTAMTQIFPQYTFSGKRSFNLFGFYLN